MKKLYNLLCDHVIGVTRVMAILLLPCAISRHFACFMVVLSVTLNTLILCGRIKHWEETNG